MSPAELLTVLRRRGYRLAVNSDGRLAVSGATPKDQARAVALLREHKSELVRLLGIERATLDRPVVREALEVFGAELDHVEVRAPSGEQWRAES